MGIGIWKLLLILVIVVMIFGTGKLSKAMGDLGKGIRNLKDGLKGDETASAEAKTALDNKADDTKPKE